MEKLKIKTGNPRLKRVSTIARDRNRNRTTILKWSWLHGLPITVIDR